MLKQLVKVHVALYGPFKRLTWIPEQLYSDANPPPLSTGHPPHIVVPHARVSALPQTQLRDDIVHLCRSNKQL